MSAFPLPPGSTIGILGGGQLGRMMCLAAARLGLRTVVLTPEKGACAAEAAGAVIIGGFDDGAALKKLSRAADVVTYEFENVPAAAVETLTRLGADVAPGAQALAVAQDRVTEKTFLNEVGVATVDFAPIGSVADLAQALERLGAPALLKTRREGYDGKGQVWIDHPEDAAAAFKSIGGRPAILEAACDFARELSVIAARGRDGEVACYPLGENHHENGILRRTSAPAKASDKAVQQAQTIAARILTRLDYVGVMGVELFQLADGDLLVNEIAPRVHNSGHWTLDGCEVDQFEQHVRAVAGWPLGPTAALAHVEMTNLIGAEADDWRALAGEQEARLWLYGKGEGRPGRKMGHVNRLRRLD